MTYVIAGVSGHTGAAAAEALLAGKHDVRALVRDAKKGEAWKARGATVVEADLADARALAKALEGADGAYLLVPPNLAAPDIAAYQDRVIGGLIEAIGQSGVPHVVFLSSVGAQHPAGNGPIAGLHRAEQAFARLERTKFTHIRAAYFMENLGGSLGMLAQGALPGFVPADFKFPMVATRDIGKLVAEKLVGGAKNEIVELGTPTSLGDAARALSKILGREIRVQEFPVAAMAGALQGFGVPAAMAAAYQEMTEGMLKGHVAFEGKHTHVAGTTSIEEVLRTLTAH